MKKDEIQVGGVYRAKVSGKLVDVRVDAIREYDPSFGGKFSRVNSQTRYEVTNLTTGRKTTFRSSQKFRSRVTHSGRLVASPVGRTGLTHVAPVVAEVLRRYGV